MGSTEPPFDVYARPFIPERLKAINEEPATVIASVQVPWIDYARYVGSFAGQDYLRADPRLPNVKETEGDRLSAVHYHSYFRKMLVAEASAQQHECQDHTLYQVPLVPSQRNRRPDMYTLSVPGLRELGLPLEIGDVVHLRQLAVGPKGKVFGMALDPVVTGDGYSVGPWVAHQYHAVIWGIDKLMEELLLNVYMLYSGSMMFNVCFTVQIGRLRSLYNAVMTAQSGLNSTASSWTRSMLFPDETDGVMQRTLSKRTVGWEPYDTKLNYEQIRAVDTVLSHKFGHVPYIILGPPGTGKTKTLVELALQLLDRDKSAALILCAPSEPAADTLVMRLSTHLKPIQLLRLNAPSRNFPEVPDAVLPFCYISQDMFTLPPFKMMMRYRTVVTTCRDADILVKARLTNADLANLEQEMHSSLHPYQPVMHLQLHWTALLIDEAAQATEPEAVIPLSVLEPPEDYESTGLAIPTFILAGDQHQLGPRTASKTPAIQTSLFERLLGRPLYRNHPLARSKQNRGVMRPLTQDMLPILRPPFTNLVRNYRSHPAILATPSSLFYHDTLEPEASDVDGLLSWPGWRGRKWPVLFACNSGTDEIEREGGGWYNLDEARIACQYAQSFIKAGLLHHWDICIMSPFRAQVKVLRTMARSEEFNMSTVNIGPLEAFQGLESKLVILCTTRTRNRFIDRDIAKGFGVIHEPRRFNVALTRAMQGLIVIGNPALLNTDSKWESFLAFCHRNGLWDNEESKQWDAKGLSGPVSRLEKQLQLLDDMGTVESGVKELGIQLDQDQELWEAGHAAQEALMYGENTEEERSVES